MEEPLVSVLMISFNHEQYIREALDSVLMQEVNFPYEIVIGDDCSTDSTQEIIREYAEKYPGMINAILRKKNIGATKNVYDIAMKCSGEYIAALEGDDFWTDSRKLQKQVDLISKSNYIAVAHNFDIVDQNGKIIQKQVNGDKDYIFTFDSFKEHCIIASHSSTMIFKNIFKNYSYDYSIIYKGHPINGDLTIIMLLVLQGDIFVSKECMSSYRQVMSSDSSSWSSLVNKKNVNLEFVYYIERLENYINKYTGHKVYYPKRLSFLSAFFWCFKRPNIDNFKILLKIFIRERKKSVVIFYLCKSVWDEVKNRLKKTNFFVNDR